MSFSFFFLHFFQTHQSTCSKRRQDIQTKTQIRIGTVSGTSISQLCNDGFSTNQQFLLRSLLVFSMIIAFFKRLYFFFFYFFKVSHQAVEGHCESLRQKVSSPVHHRVSVEGHEENLAAASGTHRRKEDLQEEQTETMPLNNRWTNPWLRGHKCDLAL